MLTDGAVSNPAVAEESRKGEGVQSWNGDHIQDRTPFGALKGPRTDLRLGALDQLRRFFATTSHHRPSEAMWDGLADLIGTLADMANGEADPRFFLSSLDPGVGKTSAIVAFVRMLLTSPDHEHVGVLLCVSRKSEIEALLSELDLGPDEKAVLTSDDELNSLGSSRPDEAQVLITTQQMVESRCRGRAFRDANEFHFFGSHRQVRIWDEAMLPGVPVTLSADDLHRLIPDVRSPFPHLANCLERLLDEVREAMDGGRVAVPDFAESFELDLMADPILAAVTTHQRNSVMALALLTGKTVTVRRDRPGVHTLLDYEDVIPGDLAPVVITDASGRVRATYDHWARGRGNLLTLRSAQKRYEPLTVHLWQRGGGKSSFRRDGPEIASEIAAVINQKPNEPWLVVHHKATGVLDVENDVRSRLNAPLATVHFLHWGNHQATNAFVKVPNVILAGTLFFPPSHYEALGRASAGIDAADDLASEAYKEIVLGEHRHVILQAICRGAVRACQDDVCAPCHAYVIASGRSGIADELRTVFPGCKVVAWQPRREKLPEKVGLAVEYITQRLNAEPDVLVPFRDVMDAIGVPDRSNFRRVVRRDHRFIDRLQSLSIFEGPDLERARGFVRVDRSDGLRVLEEEDERNGDF